MRFQSLHEHFRAKKMEFTGFTDIAYEQQQQMPGPSFQSSSSLRHMPLHVVDWHLGTLVVLSPFALLLPCRQLYHQTDLCSSPGQACSENYTNTTSECDLHARGQHPCAPALNC